MLLTKSATKAAVNSVRKAAVRRATTAAKVAAAGVGVGIGVKLYNEGDSVSGDDRGFTDDKSKDQVYGPTKRRVKPRKKTLEEVDAAQPKNEKGEMVSPDTGEVLKPDETDLGHKIPWREKKMQYEKEGLTRKEVIERENDASNYQWEDRYDNRSHRFESK